MEGRGGWGSGAVREKRVRVGKSTPGQEGEKGRLVRSCGRFLGFLARKLENRIMWVSSSKRVLSESVSDAERRTWLCLRREKRGRVAREEGM